MNWTQFKDPAFHLYLAGAVLVPRSLTQEFAGLSPFNDKYFFTEFSETLRKKSIVLIENNCHDIFIAEVLNSFKRCLQKF